MRKMVQLASMNKAQPVHGLDIPPRKRNSQARLAARLACLACLAAAVAACTPTRDYRGFIAQEDTISQVRIGMSRAQVEELLGTPSAQSSYTNPHYYYISSVFETTAFFDPEEVDRKVYAIEFDGTDRVSRLAYYGMKDGKVFDFISRTTPTRGRETNLVQEILGNIGRFGGGTDRRLKPTFPGSGN
jgi:outer membrane protein assembly factor BamE (lipoprotein component of BamABCDE complex)